MVITKKVNRYTLLLIEDEKEPTIFEKTTLENLDTITTCFENEKELIKNFAYLLDKGFDPSTTKIKITYKHCKEVKNVEVLYSKDRLILDKEATKDYILQHMNNKGFVIKFINRYTNSKYYMRFKKDIMLKISSGEDYTDVLWQLLDNIFYNYKSLRDAYLFTKKHEKREVKKHDEEVKSSNNNQIRVLEEMKRNLYYQYTLGDLSEKIENQNNGLSKVKNK